MKLRVGEQGRMVIPSDLRKQLGIEVGTELVARVEGECLILETRTAVLNRLKKLFAQIPSEISMVDELILERRNEAEIE